MQIEFRLNELLTRMKVVKHGRIAQVSGATGIERHKVSRLLEGREQRISLRHLGALCDYLIDECGVDAKELPGALFSLEPSGFLSLLQRMPTLRTCFGVRQRSSQLNVPPWSSHSDSVLHGKMLEILLRRLPTATSSVHEQGSEGESDEIAAQSNRADISHFHFHQEQVHAATRERINSDDAETREQEMKWLEADANRVYSVLHPDPRTPSQGSGPGPKPEALTRRLSLILGSVKSNPVCELSNARVFAAPAWASHGRSLAAVEKEGGRLKALPASPMDRAVPFFIRYRNGEESISEEGSGEGRRVPLVDPSIPSCHAGMELAKSRKYCLDDPSIPGIHYETKGGWKALPWDKVNDAAIVLFDHDKLDNNVEVVMGGFSSRATMLLAHHMERLVDDLYPAGFVSDTRAVGVFIIPFRIDPDKDPEWGPGGKVPALTERAEPIPLDAEVLERRLS